VRKECIHRDLKPDNKSTVISLFVTFSTICVGSPPHKYNLISNIHQISKNGGRADEPETEYRSEAFQDRSSLSPVDVRFHFQSCEGSGGFIVQSLKSVFQKYFFGGLS
jgi:hypothetical protein